MGALPEANPAKHKLFVYRSGPAADLASGIASDLKLWLSAVFYY
jgi:hypothetical protein